MPSIINNAFDRLVWRYRRTGPDGNPNTNDDEWAEAYAYDPQNNQIVLRFDSNFDLSGGEFAARSLGARLLEERSAADCMHLLSTTTVPSNRHARLA